MTAGSLAAAFERRPDGRAAVRRVTVDLDSRAFAALNTAFAADGAYVFVPDGVVLEQPIHVLFVSSPAGLASRTMSHPAHADCARRSAARPGSSRSYVGLPGQPYFVERGHRGGGRRARGARSLQGAGESGSTRSTSPACTCGRRAAPTSRRTPSRSAAKLTRNDAIATLAGEGSECTLNGLYLADGDRLVDNHTTIDHAQPHCPSHEIYKGILGGKARAVFNGKIIVRQDAQKTDAKQTNRALLLSDDATINTKPQLEIFADDVKCTHGAAIGQLDEDALFYLRARGLTFQEARDMLIHAFAGDILDRVKIEPLKRRARARALRAAGEGSRGGGPQMTTACPGRHPSRRRARSAPISRSCAARSAASRSSISTTPRRRRSRRRCSTR